MEQNAFPAIDGSRSWPPGDRGQCLVEAGESFAHPSLRDEGEPAVGQRPHLEIGLAVLEGDLEGSVGALQQVIDVGTGARQHRELEPAPLDARPDAVEEPASPPEPSLPGSLVPE